ncbi:T9SS type A sorting domain-containing protein [Pedobacter helvus]|uniref:T9SS type A sorting domain-containing protein n=1 Tax=Pedobacter helvus TaxID=2563444 RepID=A0ABW9JMG2_9SPHI|nr:T9SS type A sorting domain-containing protein [Pedobacter ureilyticus]
MKKYYLYLLVVFAALLFQVGQIFGQVNSISNPIIAWQFARGYTGASGNATGQEVTVNSTTNHANLEISVLKRGAGASIPSGANTRTFNATFPNAGTKSDAQQNNRYYEFSVQAKTGYKVSLTALRVVLRRLSTSPNTYRWAFSVNEPSKADNAKVFTEIGSSDISHTNTDSNGDLQDQVTLSGITAIQNVSADSAVTFRLYAWGATAANAPLSIGKSNNNDGTGGNNNIALAIGGSVTGVVDIYAPFEPWNQTVWASHYDGSGKLTKAFNLDRNVVFGTRATPWQPEFSSAYVGSYLLEVAKQGITINGNNVEIDVRSAEKSQSLVDLYVAGRDPWTNGTTIGGLRHSLNEELGTANTLIKKLKISGFNRGMVFTNTGNGHPVLLDSCTFTRNNFGIYLNGKNNAIIQNCTIIESGMGGVYSGSKSQSNIFRYNLFRDNMLSQHQPSYGNFIGDTFFNTQLRRNTFAKSLVTNSSLSHIGISIFRNAGEDDNLREEIPHNLVIDSNTFDGYSIGIHVASRMGRYPSYDISKEGRDYAFYNQIKKNDFLDCSIGIKINSEGNTVDGNSFTNTTYQIVLHPVFFKLINNTINNQSGDTVHVWYMKGNYSAVPNQAFLFNYHDDANSLILRNEKRVEVLSTTGTPTFTAAGGLNSGEFELNPTPPLDVLVDHRVGAPLVRKEGEFQEDLAGNEVVAIWNDKISRITNTDYYSIIIFDQNGMEINRCGRSEIGWSQLAVGYFVRTEGEMEIAVVPKTAIDGKYPVYIFRRGFAEPQTILYPDNTDASIQISTDSLHHLVVTFDSSARNLLSFKAEPDKFGSAVVVSWKTENGLGTKEFVIEKKTNAEGFLPIGKKTSTDKHGAYEYQFLDASRNEGISYYRLRQVAHNGSNTYSSIVSAKFIKGFSFFPNPAGDKITVHYSTANGKAALKLIAIDGREVLKQNLADGSSSCEVDVSTLNTGNYLLLFENKQRRYTLKFIKK